MPHAMVVAMKRDHEGQPLGLVRDGSTGELLQVCASKMKIDSSEVNKKVRNVTRNRNNKLISNCYLYCKLRSTVFAFVTSHGTCLVV